MGVDVDVDVDVSVSVDGIVVLDGAVDVAPTVVLDLDRTGRNRTEPPNRTEPDRPRPA